jgi:hypothetical protein
LYGITDKVGRIIKQLLWLKFWLAGCVWLKFWLTGCNWFMFWFTGSNWLKFLIYRLCFDM